MVNQQLIIRQLGLQPYAQTLDAMHHLTACRDQNTPDEIWFVEHPAIFTQGQAGKAAHILRHSHIPIFQSDRGGQVTYHAPGQQIMYLMIDLKRQTCRLRDFISIMERTVIHTLAEYHIQAQSKCDAPGVYVGEQKICSLGLRIKKGCTLHGLALNIDMDLTPFHDINPCGYADMVMTQLSHYVQSSCLSFDHIRQQLLQHFLTQMPYSSPIMLSTAYQVDQL